MIRCGVLAVIKPKQHKIINTQLKIMTLSSPTTPTAGKVAVIGATGGVGRFVVKHALKKGYAVIALARNKEKLLQVVGKDDFDRLESFVEGSCDDLTKLEETISGADFVISCLGTPSGQKTVVESGTKNVIATMKKVGVKNLAMISSCGVGDSVKQAKKNATVFMYVVKPLFLSKLFQDLEEAEKVCKQESGLNIVRVRPPHLQVRDCDCLFDVCCNRCMYYEYPINEYFLTNIDLPPCRRTNLGRELINGLSLTF